MKQQPQPEDSVTFPGKLSPHFGDDQCWFDDATILDIDYFVKTLSGIKAKGVRNDLVGSVITHYASKWLPDLSDDGDGDQRSLSLTNFQDSPESITTSWMKKRFFIETLVGVLPPEKDLIPCNFLLRLLRTASMVGVEPAYKSELEKRVTWQLDQASLKEVMIPSFSHTSRTVLDVELVTRLVKRFVSLDDGVRSGAALVKVAKLVDCYLAEAAMDANLGLPEFVELAGALPNHARAADDGLYRGIDTYLKAHPNLSKQERKSLCRLMDSRKLSTEASLHAAQNDRLPVRAVIQVLFSEQTKLNSRHLDWSGSIGGGTRSPTAGFDHLPTRCQSKREITAQQMEIKRLKDTIVRLQNQCNVMQVQMERVLEKKKGFFKWRRFGVPGFKNVGDAEKMEDGGGRGGGEVGEDGFGRQTPVDLKTKLVKRRTPSKTWRKSVS